MNSMSEDAQHHPVFGALNGAWHHWLWNSHITVCFTPPDSGWADLVIVSSAFGQHHVSYLSYIGAPFHELLDWLTDIVNDQLPASVLIDEEGKYTRLSILPYDDCWLEFRAVRIYDDKMTCRDISDAEAERSIVCRVNKYPFLNEWRRRFADFILHDFRPEAWVSSSWYDYLNNAEYYPRYADIRRLNFDVLDEWLERNRPRTISIKRVISGCQSNSERIVIEWAIQNRLTYGGWCQAGRKAEDGVIDAKYDLIELPTASYRFSTKANIRDCDAVLIVSDQDNLLGRCRLSSLFAQRMGKPWLHLYPGMDWLQALTNWLDCSPIDVINITAPNICGDLQFEVFIKKILDVLPTRGKNNRDPLPY